MFQLGGFISVSPGWSQKWRKGWAGQELCGSKGGLRRRCARPEVTPSQGEGVFGVCGQRRTGMIPNGDFQVEEPRTRNVPVFSLSQPDPEDKSVLVFTHVTSVPIKIQNIFHHPRTLVT